jgi:hypothetical protein
VLKWIVPLPVLALGAFLALPRLKELKGTGEVAAPARAALMVRFDVFPPESQLFLDGSPIASNEVSLGKGELHMVSGKAPGFDLGHQKFLVDQPKTVSLRLERTRGRR